jgi:serine/threonine protein kinase
MTWDEKKWDEKTLKRLAELSEEVAREPIPREIDWGKFTKSSATLSPTNAESSSTDSDQPKTKRCPACNFQFSGTLVVCRHDGSLLIPMRAGPFGEQSVESTSDDVEVLKFIGKGTLTTVYSGTCRLTTKEVVVKVLNRDLLADGKTVKRFVKGAQQSLKLIHPNIAQTFAVQNVRQRGSEPYLIPCLVAEKVNGPNLNQLLIERKTLEPDVVASIVIDVCSALQYAVSEGIEHHDLKPSNIYLSTEPKGTVPKVVDFGMAERLFRNLEWSAPPLPDGRTASIYGDPSCTSPESAFEGRLSAASEIYSLGCIMYAVLSGDNPFIGNNHFDTLMKHKEMMPPPLGEVLVPENMENIIFKCLEKDPQNRYHSFDELKEALSHV